MSECMKQLNEEVRYFSAALRAEMTARGRGIQKELSLQTGISISMICDLRKGRTGASSQKRKALAQALGYQKYEDFIAKGRSLEEERLQAPAKARLKVVQVSDNTISDNTRGLEFKLETANHRAYVLAEKLIAMQERHISAQEEIVRLHKEVHKLQLSKRGIKALCGPIEGIA